MVRCPSCGKDVPDNADVCPNCGYSFAEEKTVEIKRIPASMLHEFDPLMEKLGEKYEILGLLGRGGFSTVLLVEDRILRRKCALKVLSSEVAGSSQELMERFKREARMYAELEHPNIVPIYDVGFYGNRAYILMKFIEGKTLKEIISERAPLPLNEIVSISIDILSALDYMHSKGIVHRDIKPANIIIESKSGKAILADFGLAKRIEAGTHLTRSGELLGTPHYLSPEQAKGDKITSASDIYSFGITLYEMTTGSLPFSGDTPLQILWKHVKEPVPIPSKINPDIHPFLEKVILKAVEKRPKNRYKTAEEMLSEIEKLRFELIPEELKVETGKKRYLIPIFLFLLIAAGGVYYSSAWMKSRSRESVVSSKQKPVAETVGKTSETPGVGGEKRIERVSEKSVIPEEGSASKENIASKDITDKFQKAIQQETQPLEKKKIPVKTEEKPPSLISQTSSIKPVGVLVLRANLPSKFYIDGVGIGTLSPGQSRKIELQEGQHKIKFETESISPVSRTVNLTKGETVYINQVFQAYGTINLIGSSPWGDIYIDGQRMKENIIRNLKLKAGVHTIVIKKKGYKTITQRFELKPNQTIERLWFKLEKEEK